MAKSKFSAKTVPVKVSTPTGFAAFNISGTTIHRTLCLSIEHGKPPNYSRLNQENLNVIRKSLHGLKLLITEEVSMVSSLTLLCIYIHITVSVADVSPGSVADVSPDELLDSLIVAGNSFQIVAL